MSEQLEAGDVVALLHYNRCGAVTRIEVAQVRVGGEQTVLLEVPGNPRDACCLHDGGHGKASRIAPTVRRHVRLICKGHEIALPSDIEPDREGAW
jgi:hypothetical protein